MKKPIKSILRAWLAVASAFIFLATWVILGHSPKPLDSRYSSVTPLPTLAPFQPLSEEQSRAFGWQLFSQNNRPRQRQVFVTGGS